MEGFDKTIKKLDLFEKYIRFDNFVFDYYPNLIN